MIYTKAYAKNQELKITEGKRLVIHFPKNNTNEKMDLFYGNANLNDSTTVNWVVDSTSLVKTTLKLASYAWWYPAHDDSTTYNFVPKNYVDTGYFWNPIDFYVSKYAFSKATKEEALVAFNKVDWEGFDSWNDYGFQCEMNISEEGDIVNAKVNTKTSESTEKEILAFLKGLPQLQPGTNKHGEIIERRGLLFLQGGNIIPLYKTDEAYLKSFNSKYAKYENKPIKSVNDAELNYYIFSVSKLGWINCDRFLNFEEKTDLIVLSEISNDLHYKLAFKDFNGFIKANLVNGKYVFKNVPVGEKATLVGIRSNDDVFETSINDIIIKAEPLTEPTFNETTLAKLKADLESI